MKTNEESFSGSVLVVDDDQAMRDLLVLGLGARGYRVSTAASGQIALSMLKDEPFDVVVTDLRMPAMGGLEVAREVKARLSDVPVIVLTAFGDYDGAIEAVRAGAYDFFAKPIKMEVLAAAVHRAATHRALTRRVHELERSAAPPKVFGELVGTSAPMLRLYDLLGRLANSESSVLITGESGTGKEVVAEALHKSSPRAQGPFVALNCAALPEGMLESELFGHEKGAFTDARTARPGLFLAAHHGTLFLDEIAELPLPLQAKLLRALQERVVRPMGSNSEVPFDVRLLAATNRDLETMVESGQFRKDLYFRIQVIEVHLPPLRSRGSDVLVLAQHFLTILAARAKKGVVGFTPQAAERLLNYTWPGNVRELQNAIEHAVALCTHDHITLENLPERTERHRRSPESLIDASQLLTLEEMEKQYILQVLDASGGNKTVAAKVLGLDRTTLWRKLERYQISVPDRVKP